MVQFLSIIFFSWISWIFVGFFKSSRFFVSLCTWKYLPVRFQTSCLNRVSIWPASIITNSCTSADPVAARSKAWVCVPSLAGIAGSNTTGDMGGCCECCVLSGRGLCVGLITRTEESHRLWCVWVWSWIPDNDEALAHWGVCRAFVKKKLFYMFRPMKVHHQEVSCRIQAYGIMLCPSVYDVANH